MRSVSAGGRSALDVWPARLSGAVDLDTKPPVVGTAYLWDGDVVAEEAPLRLDGSIDWENATRWHYELGGFVPLAKEGPDGSLAYAVTDHLGTPRELVDAGGSLLWAAEYRTWGAIRRLWIAHADNDNPPRRDVLPSSVGRTFGALALKDDSTAIDALQVCSIRFQGQSEDQETGIFFNRFRQYDTASGQYLSSEPLGFCGGPVDLHMLLIQRFMLTTMGLLSAATLVEKMNQVGHFQVRIIATGLTSIFPKTK